MNILCNKNSLIIENIEHFNIKDVLECGQCFHFTKLCEDEYEIIAFEKYLHVKQTDKTLTLFDTTMEEYELIWRRYFDIDRDYAKIKQYVVKADERLFDAVLKKSGIRLLKQDFFETLISFIISQNKQIPHIKQIVHNISERFGEKIETSDGVRYAFPTVDRLALVSEEELRECKVGFRAPYIMDATRRVYNGELSETMLSKETYEQLRMDNAAYLIGKSGKQMTYPEYVRHKLMEIKGVGEKVANCVMLFGLSIFDAFPVDVWMKRIMEELYFDGDTKKDIIEQFGMEKFGEYAGFAQQYLFCYGREQGKKL